MNPSLRGCFDNCPIVPIVQKLDCAECSNAFELNPPHLKSFFGQKVEHQEGRINQGEWRYCEIRLSAQPASDFGPDNWVYNLG